MRRGAMQPAVGAKCYNEPITSSWTSCPLECADEWRVLTETYGCCATTQWGAQFATKVRAVSTQRYSKVLDGTSGYSAARRPRVLYPCGCDALAAYAWALSSIQVAD
jgi:hypothetical protein